jgi:hypothetical protein
VRAWEQQCEVLQTYQGMAKTCHFQVRLEVKPETAIGRRHGCLSLGFTERAHAVLIVLMSWDNLNEYILIVLVLPKGFLNGILQKLAKSVQNIKL